MTTSLVRHVRLPLVLLAILILVAAATAWSPPAGRTNWALEWGRDSP